jgi:hypothetical protein
MSGFDLMFGARAATKGVGEEDGRAAGDRLLS